MKVAFAPDILAGSLVLWIAFGAAVFNGAGRSGPKGPARRRRAQKDKWQMLFEKYPQPTWVFDQETLHFLAVSQRAVRHYGYSSQEFLSMTIKDISLDDDVPRFLECLEATGEPPDSTGIWTHRKKDGSFIDVEIFLERIDFGGKPAWLEVAYDVTGPYRAGDVLLKRNQTLQTIFDRIPVMITLYDSSGKIQWANQEGSRVLGWSPEELQQIDLLEASCPDAESSQEALKFMLEAPPEWRDFKLRTRYGHTVDTSWTSIRLPDGSCIGLGKDVTQQKRVEDALVTVEATLREMTVSISDCLWSAEVDSQGRSAGRRFSPVERKITRKPPRFFMVSPGKWLGIIHPEDRAQMKQALQKLLERRFLREGEECRIFRTGGASGSAVATALDSEGIRLDGAAGDITYRKRAEETVRKLSGRLLRLQDEERRRLARELHEVTAQSLGALIMNLGLVQQAERTLGNRERRALTESLAIAKECSKQVRTFSYLLHPPLLDELGLASALNWFVEGFRSRSGIQVDIKLPENLGRLPQEVETTLFRVVQECFTNILRHSGSSSASVRVASHSNQVTLEVADRGKGIGSDVLKKVRRNPASLGVGISGMQERLRQLGGTLEIDSNSSGTKVRAIVPATKTGQ